MKTPLTEMFGIELPIFAFSHCRDVVVEVSKAGGMGVLGVANFSAEQLELELRWIDRHVGGRPYGIDILVPNRYQKMQPGKVDVQAMLPKTHWDFVKQICDAGGLDAIPEVDAGVLLATEAAHINMTPDEAEELLQICLQHPVKLVVNALGTPPRDRVVALQARGIRVGSMVAKPEHARAQIQAGVDVLIAQGTEAGGHTGDIASLVLWPEIVDLAAPLPVLAAGGVGNGRQMAAALALGASGVWCGSVWLGTRESELSPQMKDRMFEAGAADAVRTRALTGKPCRALRSLYTEAWDAEGAPKPLPMPLQTLLWVEPRARADRSEAKEWMTYPVGQVVGTMKEETSVRAVIQGMLGEFIDAIARLSALVEL